MSNLPNSPKIIDEATFWNALESKAPERYTTNTAYEFFLHPDDLGNNKCRYFVQIKKPTQKFVTVIADKLIPNEDLIKICK